MQEIPIKCDCGKVILKVRDGKPFGYCKRCKKEVEVILPPEFEFAVNAKNKNK